jgi:acyl phosphate:glycerol-3-phosphate acyltransferase
LSLLVFFLAYLLGSFSPSHLVAEKWFKKDLKQVGSGNLGALNTLRSFGFKPGLVVFVLDVAKGALAVYLAVFCRVNPLWGMAGVVAGHNFSIALKFAGGKGLAAALGSLLVLDPRYAGILILIGLFLLLTTKKLHLAAVVMVSFLPLVILYFDPTPLSVALGVVISVLIILKHRPNFAKTR